MRRPPPRQLAIAASAVVATAALAAGGTALATSTSTTSSPTSQAPVWGTNANGQTYGSAAGTPGPVNPATEPTLVSVIATNHQVGYVYSSQLNPPAPSSPAQALAEMAANRTGRFIPVYAQDGTTVIGQFEAAEPGSAAG